MDILGFAKKTLAFWRDRDVHYAIPEPIQAEDFMFRDIDGQRYLTIRKAKSIAQQVIYPEQRGDSIWHTQAMNKLIKSVESMFAGRGYFDVCVVTSAISTFDLSSCPSTGKALEGLRAIHCVSFSDMSAEVFEAIPRYLSHIFTEGRVPLEAVGCDVEVELKKPADAPVLSPENALVRELSDLANDALSALTSGVTSQEILDGLRARQRQVLDKMLSEEA